MPKLSVNELGSGYTHAFKFDYRDLQTTGFLTTIGAANQRIIGKMDAGDVIDQVTVINTVAEAGATDLVLDVGITDSDPDEFIDALDLDGLTKAANNTGDAFVVTATGATVALTGYVNNTATGAPIYMELNTTGASSLTAGEWIIAWRQSSIGSLA